MQESVRRVVHMRSAFPAKKRSKPRRLQKKSAKSPVTLNARKEGPYGTVTQNTDHQTSGAEPRSSRETTAATLVDVGASVPSPEVAEYVFELVVALRVKRPPSRLVRGLRVISVRRGHRKRSELARTHGTCDRRLDARLLLHKTPRVAPHRLQMALLRHEDC